MTAGSYVMSNCIDTTPSAGSTEIGTTTSAPGPAFETAGTLTFATVSTAATAGPAAANTARPTRRVRQSDLRVFIFVPSSTDVSAAKLAPHGVGSRSITTATSGANGAPSRPRIHDQRGPRPRATRASSRTSDQTLGQTSGSTSARRARAALLRSTTCAPLGATTPG